jgi:hypothetical protein
LVKSAQTNLRLKCPHDVTSSLPSPEEPHFIFAFFSVRGVPLQFTNSPSPSFGVSRLLLRNREQWAFRRNKSAFC